MSYKVNEKQKMPKVRYNYSTSFEILKEIKIAAAKEGCPVNEFIDEAVKNYISSIKNRPYMKD